MQKQKTLLYILINILCTAFTVWVVTLGLEATTHQSWRTWIMGDTTRKLEDKLSDTHHDITALRGYIQQVEKTTHRDAEQLLPNETLLKHQKITWLGLTLHHKFTKGEPYENEWKALLSLLPPSVLQHPSILELSRHAGKGILTKAKMRALLVPTTSPAAPSAEPSNAVQGWMEQLKSWVTIERITPPVPVDDIMDAFHTGQLNAYIKRHPEREWMRFPLEEYHGTHHAIGQFYNLLTPFILEPAGAHEVKK